MSLRRVDRSVIAAALAVVLLLAVVIIVIQPFQSGASEPESRDRAGFVSQDVRWRSCGDAECAKVSTPLDWSNLKGEYITLGLAKLPATGETRGTLFVNPGGPGASGVDYVKGAAEKFSDLREHYDIVGWDPRGVGESTPVECYTDKEMDDYLFGNNESATPGTDAWLKEVEKQNKAFGAACEKRSGDLLKFVDTQSTVHDLDMLRELLGDTQLNYLGFSYGTYIGALYADAFPEHVGRLVLDGAMDPTTTVSQVVYAQTLGFEHALRVYVASCLAGQGCPLSGDVDAAMGQIHDMLKQLEKEPLKGRDGRLVTVSTMLTAIVTPLYSQQSWPMLTQLFTEIPDGETSTALALADFYYDRSNTGEYTTNSNEAFSAINCLDYPEPTDLNLDRLRDEAEALADAAPTIGEFQGYADVSCYGWPVKSKMKREPVTGKGAAPILVVGTTGDPATPYSWAESLAEQLESGVLVTYEGEGHTAYGESECIDRTVDQYFFEGKMPADGLRCK